MARLRPKDALDAIHVLLDGREWDADTVDAIAQIVANAGYTIRGIDAETESRRDITPIRPDHDFADPREET